MLTNERWTPVTTELKDRWIGREYWFQAISRAFDVPVDDIRPWSFANAEAEYKEMRDRTLADIKRFDDLLPPIMGKWRAEWAERQDAVVTDMLVFGEAYLLVDGNDVTPIPHAEVDPAWKMNDIAVRKTDWTDNARVPQRQRDAAQTRDSVGSNPTTGTCEVCKQPITPGQRYVHHQLLDADIHGFCPLNDVRGVDLTTHAMKIAVWGES